MALLSNNDTKIMTEWDVLFEKTFSESKKNIRSRYPIHSDRSGNPKSVANPSHIGIHFHAGSRSYA